MTSEAIASVQTMRARIFIFIESISSENGTNMSPTMGPSGDVRFPKKRNHHGREKSEFKSPAFALVPRNHSATLESGNECCLL